MTVDTVYTPNKMCETKEKENNSSFLLNLERYRTVTVTVSTVKC